MEIGSAWEEKKKLVSFSLEKGANVKKHPVSIRFQKNHDNQVYRTSIRCTAPNCTCEGFTPSKPSIRSCDSCHHGWVAHGYLAFAKSQNVARSSAPLPAINLDKVFPKNSFDREMGLDHCDPRKLLHHLALSPSLSFIMCFDPNGLHWLIFFSRSGEVLRFDVVDERQVRYH
ncbi:hypothetical protein TNCV_1975191 [Trichonephila clavipes]|nr:hypothetical protein TNCV_1975191 [Trichonephila clavipes]